MINQYQRAASLDPARFQYWLAGRRGGKTHAIRHKILKELWRSPKRSKIVYMGPSNQHAKDLIWEDMEEAFDDLGWTYRSRISKSCFYLPGKRKLYVIGAEKYSRVRGHGLWHLFMDELAHYDKPLDKIWRAARPSLSDMKGGATLTTTPDGKGTQAYDWWIDKQADPDWSTHFWKTIDNPWIDPEEVEAAKRDLDELSFLQEYEAAWMSFEGLAYYSFDENLHIKKQPKLDPYKPIKLCFDFNVNPTTLLISQRDGTMNRYFDEYSLSNSSTEKTVLQFCDDYQHLTKDHHELKIRGDSTGRNRSSTTGYSDYKYVQDILTDAGFRHSMDVPSRNPSIIDRVKYANSWLKPFKGDHRVEIDPKCKDLIRDLASQTLNGRHPSDKNNLGHKADAFGYDIYYEEVHTKTRTVSSIQL